MKTLIRSLGIAALAAAMTTPAAAQTCRDMVDRFAASQNLSSSAPPVVAPPAGSSGSTTDGAATGSGASSDQLARSGGVIQPPAVGDTAVIEPPRSGTMQTTPQVRPDSGATTDTPSGSTMNQAAQRAQMESLVTAARTAAQRGEEAQCMESLQKARAMGQGTTGSGQGG